MFLRYFHWALSILVSSSFQMKWSKCGDIHFYTNNLRLREKLTYNCNFVEYGAYLLIKDLKKVQNFILCLILNLKDLIITRNRMKHIRDVCRRYWKVTEFDFTLLPTSDVFYLKEPNHDKKFFPIISTLAAYLFSSIPEKPQIYNKQIFFSAWRRIVPRCHKFNIACFCLFTCIFKG